MDETINEPVAEKPTRAQKREQKRRELADELRQIRKERAERREARRLKKLAKKGLAPESETPTTDDGLLEHLSTEPSPEPPAPTFTEAPPVTEDTGVALLDEASEPEPAPAPEPEEAIVEEPLPEPAMEPAPETSDK